MTMSTAAPGACTKRDLHLSKPVNKVQQQVQHGLIQSALTSGKAFAAAQVRKFQLKYALRVALTLLLVFIIVAAAIYA